MIHTIYIYRSESLDPYYNIATEKYLLETVNPGCCILYLWQNQNTVVIGKNQNAWAECKTSLLEQEGGKLARRLSGGGAVFHDVGNLNFTFLMQEEDYDLNRQLTVIQTACAAAGITAERSGRNDLLVDGQKFSGNAFYHSKNRAYHHGTLLVDTDMTKLSRYLTPSKLKLEAKGVASVRSRVANLCQFAPGLDCKAMGVHMEGAFAQVYGLTPQLLTLTEDAVTNINESAKQLQSWEWLYGPTLPFSFRCEERFDWGSIALHIQVKEGYIQQIQVFSDAMQWDISELVTNALTGCRFKKEDMCDRLQIEIQNMLICDNICSMISKQEI